MGYQPECKSAMEVWQRNQLDLARVQNLRLAGENLQLKERIHQLEGEHEECPCKSTDKA